MCRIGGDVGLYLGERNYSEMIGRNRWHDNRTLTCRSTSGDIFGQTPTFLIRLCYTLRQIQTRHMRLSEIFARTTIVHDQLMIHHTTRL